MRNAFADEITKLVKTNRELVLLSGDIGNRLFDSFKLAAHDRFFNCGIAEANMIGVAAGMAMNGLRPVAYTIAPFITYRCFEQIRVDLCYHNVPVIIVGVGSGLGYASLGATHHSCEDVACMRTLPNMTVICPGDPIEVRAAITHALTLNSPTYIRLGKKGEPLIHTKAIDFKIGKAIVIKEGSKVCLLANGTILPEAVEIAKNLANHTIDAELASFHTVKPLDTEYLQKIFQNFDYIVTLEEHSLIGGFGSAVAEWLVDNTATKSSGYNAKLIRAGLDDVFFHEAGKTKYAREKLGFSVDGITKRILELL